MNSFKPMKTFCVVQNELGGSQIVPGKLQKLMKYNM